MAVNLRTAKIDPRPNDPVNVRAGPVPPGIAVLDEPLGEISTQEFRPILRVDEASTSSQSFTELVRYDVPDGHVGLLDEVSVSAASNGEVIIGLMDQPVSALNDVDFDAHYNGAYLYPGQRVRVLHQSTDGASATNRASITVREV